MSYDMIDRFFRNNLGDDDYAEYSAALDSLCAPLNTEQVSVAWPEPMEHPPLYADEDQAEQMRAFRYRSGWNDCLEKCKLATHSQPKAEQDPNREPLTDEQINECYGAANVVNNHIPHEDVMRIARAIESAHGINVPLKGEA